MLLSRLGVIALLSATMAGAQAQSASTWVAAPLQDAGFEGGTRQVSGCTRVTGSLPMAWQDNSCWQPQSRIAYEPSVTPSRSGRAVKVTLGDGLFQLTQPQTLKPDSHYRQGIWLRAQKPMVVKLSLRQASAPYMDYGARTVLIEDEWTQVQVSSFTNGLWDTDSRQAMFIISSATPGTLWIDDASLQVAPRALALPPNAVPATYFGTHVMQTVNVRTGMAESKAGSVRIWDSAQSQWHQVQKERPKGPQRRYQWSTLDERVAQAERNHQKLLMVVGGYAPAWASMAEDADLNDLPDCFRCDESPRRPADWQAWVGDLTARYKGRSIDSWEIWNEPNFPPRHPWCPDAGACRSGLGSGYRGTPEQLLALQDEAARIIRQADPAAKVVSAGVSYHHRNYFDYFLRIGGGRQADAIGYHLYAEGPPELSMPHVLALRGLMQDHGVGGKPLWNTESGISEISLDIDPAVRQAQATGGIAPRKEELAPAYMARWFLVGWASGLERLYQYAWDDQHNWPGSPTRINRQNNTITSVNDSGEAFRQVRRWMVGQRLVRMETGQNGGLWRAVLQDSAGKASQVLWHPGRPAGAAMLTPVPAGARQQCDLQGECRPVPAEGIKVDYRPVWVGP